MALTPAARERLEQAAGALVEEWRLLVEDAISQAEVAASAAEVVAAIARDTPPTDPGTSFEGTALTRRLLILLRRRLLESPEGIEPAQLVDLLGRIERWAAVLDPRWSDRFHDRMSGPSGLDLIVEVAHDLRSPLTSILFLAETMLHGRSGPLTPLQERQLGLVYSAAFGLNAVASDVIELVRGGDRLVGRETQPFSMTEVLESVRDIVLPIAEEKGLELRFSGLPRDHRQGHPGALNRILLNLTTNALKFTSEGHVEVALDEVDDATIHVAVRDTGRGIPDAGMPTLFEPFRRRQQAGNYAFSGSGLGLSICRKLVEAMGSTLEVRTVQGEGTEFSFQLHLPVAEPGALIG